MKDDVITYLPKLPWPPTPLKANMEPKDHQIEKEHHLPSLHF